MRLNLSKPFFPKIVMIEKGCNGDHTSTNIGTTITVSVEALFGLFKRKTTYSITSHDVGSYWNWAKEPMLTTVSDDLYFQLNEWNSVLEHGQVIFTV